MTFMIVESSIVDIPFSNIKTFLMDRMASIEKSRGIMIHQKKKGRIVMNMAHLRNKL